MPQPTSWHFSRRQMPHFQPDDATSFVTYRLAHVVSALERDRLTGVYPGLNASDEAQAEYFRVYDHVLDAALHGPKFLRQPEICTIIESSLNFACEQWLDRVAYTIMRNHVHFVATLTREKTLSQVMQSLKGFTAREANKSLGRSGKFWQAESFDRVVREGRLGNVVR